MNSKQIRTLLGGLALAVLILGFQPIRTEYERTNRYGNPAPSNWLPDDERNVLFLVVVAVGTAGLIYAFRNDEATL